MWTQVIAMSMVVLVAPQGANGPTTAREELTQTLRDLRGSIRDYECVYEGQEVRHVDVDTSWMPPLIKDATESQATMKAGSTVVYQGRFAFREPADFHLDLTTRFGESSDAADRTIHRLLKNDGGRRDMRTDRNEPIKADQHRSPQGVVFIKRSKSFIYLDMQPYLMALLANRDIVDWKYHGWEELRGRPCLVIEFPYTSKKTGDRIWGEKFWVDAERDGHVLRYDRDEGGKLISQLDEVKLMKCNTADGKEVWFPVSGRLRSFKQAMQPVDYVTSEQLFEVIRGTLKINQGLPNSRFELDYGFNESERRFASQVNRGERIPEAARPRTAEESLREILPGAGTEEMQLTATPRSKRSWIGRYWISIVALAVGLGAMVLAGWNLSRGR